MKLLRYCRLIAIFMGASISVQMEYRANFLVSLLSSLLTAVGALFGLIILTGDGRSIGGWSYYEATVVVGLFTLVQGFIGAFLQPNLNEISEAIRKGTMDFTLLKPIDAQFLVSTREISIFRLLDMFIGVLLIIWASTHIPGMTFTGVMLGGALMIAAFAMVYSIWFMLSTTAFWFIKVENSTELFNSVFRAGQFPVTAFPSWVRLLFTFVIPIAFITTVPAEAIIGQANVTSTLTAGGVALTLVLISRWFWQWAVRSYTSASS
ncbi:MAG: ABC transporter permease [Chloroflexi bacterium AL-W]|nr:ABC transporter permease [Chloroflexi bacterium AL-N1]NOK66908.1 ABC transporter permease [Chloroflexi bacterium AL-N10]NOK74800.1 ABC transporter permease [Chloroflexi bacterium AL-N5]NOK81510.1 ABC transporter permease [Chloroflexi bacterium AL-W]NOK88980.1 ABC transporter permease [Chloroflexi bacterium AL-N15]